MPRGKRNQDDGAGKMDSDGEMGDLAHVVGKTMPVMTALKCESCGALHDVDADTFVIFAGDIMVGKVWLFEGKNLDSRGKLTCSSVLCRKLPCLNHVLERLVPGVKFVAER
jgi:hypothetical protein